MSFAIRMYAPCITHCVLTFLLPIAFAVAQCAFVVAAEPVETILITGDRAPGTNDLFVGGVRVGINIDGHVVFEAGLEEFQGSTVWTNSGGSLHLVARQNEPAPSDPAGGTFFGFFKSIISDNDDVYFVASLRGGSVPASRGVFAERNGHLNALAVEDQPAPGFASGVSYNDLSPANPQVSPFGEVVFSGTVAGPGIDNMNSGATWVHRDESVALIVREGDAAPGVTGDIRFRGFGDPKISSTGKVTARGTLRGTDLNPLNDTGFWSERDGSLKLLVRETDGIPGQPSLTFGSMTGPFRANEESRLSFTGYRIGAGINEANDRCVFSDVRGAFETVVCEGDVLHDGQSTALVEGLMFSDRLDDDEQFAMNVHGQHAIGLTLQGRVPSIWAGTPGDLHLIAKVGENAPGAAEDDVFIEFSNPAINAAGQVSFLARVSHRTDTGTSPPRLGLWAQDVRGNLVAVVLEGEQLEVRPGDWRTVESFGYINGSDDDDGEAAFNDRGQIAFTANFTDDSLGVFISNVVAIPEPSALTLFGIGVLGICLRRRRANFCAVDHVTDV